MFFSRKKKIKRDRAAGLSFLWRSGKKEGKGGMIMAFLLTSVLFFGMFYSFKMLPRSPISNEHSAAKITLLGSVDESMTWWLEKNSPFQKKWGTRRFDSGENSVDQKLSRVISRVSGPSVKLRELIFQSESAERPSIYVAGELMLFPMSNTSEKSEVLSKEEVNTARAKLVVGATVKVFIRGVDPAQESRLPEELVYEDQINGSSKRLGQTFRYMVNLNNEGRVLSVTPLEWSVDKVWKDLENWLNSLRFQPSEGGINTMLIEVDVLPIVNVKKGGSR